MASCIQLTHAVRKNTSKWAFLNAHSLNTKLNDVGMSAAAKITTEYLRRRQHSSTPHRGHRR